MVSFNLTPFSSITENYEIKFKFIMIFIRIYVIAAINITGIISHPKRKK